VIKITADYLQPFKSKYIHKFWEGLNQEELFAPKCKKCGEKFFPPRAHCPKCLSKEFEWFKLSGEGTLYSWTSVEHTNSPPYILGIIELNERIGRSIARISGKETNLKIGMKMKIKYIQVKDQKYINWSPEI